MPAAPVPHNGNAAAGANSVTAPDQVPHQTAAAFCSAAFLQPAMVKLSGRGLRPQGLSLLRGAGMKGVNKCVVEIVEPQDESIERVLVFFKPESRAVQLGCQQDAAEKYVSGLVSWRRSILPLGPGARAALWAAAATAAAVLLWFLL